MLFLGEPDSVTASRSYHKKRVAENAITSAGESKFGSHAYKSNIKAIFVQSHGEIAAIARKCNNSEIVYAHVDFLFM